MRNPCQTANPAMNGDDYFKLVNSGTLDKYFDKWGEKEMTYLKSKYKMPVVSRADFATHFKNSYYAKSVKPKIIIKGLRKLDASLDFNGTYIAGKSTLVISSSSMENLKLILGVVNSYLGIAYIQEKYSASTYNGGITFTKDMFNEFPFPIQPSIYKDKIIQCVDEMLTSKEEAVISDLHKQIDIYVSHLYEFSYSDLEHFLDGEVPFTEAELQKLTLH